MSFSSSQTRPALRTGIPGRFFISDGKGRQGEISVMDESKKVHGRYGSSLLHPLWKAKRNTILARDHFACAYCRSKADLQVHHRQYHFIVQENKFKDPWEYDDSLLITLCKECNQQGHEIYSIPILHI